MDHRRQLRPEAESLEARSLLVGFYDGPAPAPVTVEVGGVAQGVAMVAAARAHGAGAGVTIAAGGVLSSVGFATVSGSLHATGKVERGTLEVQSSRVHLTLFLVGPVVNPSSPAPETFAFTAQGQGPGSGLESYSILQASGTVTLGFAPKGGHTAVALDFGPSSRGA
jgi:hypothetical protein